MYVRRQLHAGDCLPFQVAAVVLPAAWCGVLALKRLAGSGISLGPAVDVAVEALCPRRAAVNAVNVLSDPAGTAGDISSAVGAAIGRGRRRGRRIRAGVRLEKT
jgi:hypothetical protein